MGGRFKVQLGICEKGKSPSQKHLRTLVADLSPSIAAECEPDKQKMPSLLAEGHRASIGNEATQRRWGVVGGRFQTNVGKQRCTMKVHTAVE